MELTQGIPHASSFQSSLLSHKAVLAAQARALGRSAMQMWSLSAAQAGPVESYLPLGLLKGRGEVCLLPLVGPQLGLQKVLLLH